MLSHGSRTSENCDTLLNSLNFVRLCIWDFNRKFLQGDESQCKYNVGSKLSNAAHLLNCHYDLDSVKTVKTEVLAK